MRCPPPSRAASSEQVGATVTALSPLPTPTRRAVRRRPTAGDTRAAACAVRSRTHAGDPGASEACATRQKLRPLSTVARGPRRFARKVGRSWGRISVAQTRRDLCTRAPAASGGPLAGAAPCIEAHTVRKIGRRATGNLPEEKDDTSHGCSTLDRLLHGAWHGAASGSALRDTADVRGSRQRAAPAPRI